MAQYMLGDLDTSNLVKMGCSGMSKEPGVELFMDADLIGGGAEDILQGSGRYAFFAHG